MKDPSAAKTFARCMPALAITKYVLALGAYLCAIDFEQLKVKHVLNALLCMLCLKQREGAVAGSLALLPGAQLPLHRSVIT